MKLVKNPFYRTTGKITNISTDGIVTIKTKVDNLNMILNRNYTDVEVEFIDKRKITNQQRKAVWALIGEIAEWMGESKTQVMKTMVNEAMKYDFIVDELDEDESKMFSLSNAPISVVSEYQNFLINFVLENDIPTKMPLIQYTNDVQSYVYSCLKNKRCIVCGQKADLHHIERVGMGRNRDEIVHIGMEALPLCREHHTQAHTMTDEDFFELYHIDSGIKIDKQICDIYNLKYGKG